MKKKTDPEWRTWKDAAMRLKSEKAALLQALRELVDTQRRVVHGEATHIPAALWNLAVAAIENAEGK